MGADRHLSCIGMLPENCMHFLHPLSATGGHCTHFAEYVNRIHWGKMHTPQGETKTLSPVRAGAVERLDPGPIDGTVSRFGKGVDEFDITRFFIAGDSPCHEIDQLLLR